MLIFTPVRTAPAGTNISFYTPKNGRKNPEKTPVFWGAKTKVSSVKNNEKIVQKWPFLGPRDPKIGPGGPGGRTPPFWEFTEENLEKRPKMTKKISGIT